MATGLTVPPGSSVLDNYLAEDLELRKEQYTPPLTVLNIANSFAAARTDKLAGASQSIASAHLEVGDKIVETFSQNKMSDRELAAWVMNGWAPSTSNAIVERALEHRMTLLKRYSDVRPE